MAKEAGYSIRLLGIANRYDDDSVSTMVAPFLVKKSHPLAGVRDVFNAIYVTGNMLGETMYYGKGAGKLATASAVVADVIDAARKGSSNMYQGWDETPVKAASVSDMKYKYYVRCLDDKFDDVQAAFPGGCRIGKFGGESGFVTEEISGSDFEEKCSKLGDAVANSIRIYE